MYIFPFYLYRSVCDVRGSAYARVFFMFGSNLMRDFVETSIRHTCLVPLNWFSYKMSFWVHFQWTGAWIGWSSSNAVHFFSAQRMMSRRLLHSVASPDFIADSLVRMTCDWGIERPREWLRKSKWPSHSCTLSRMIRISLMIYATLDNDYYSDTYIHKYPWIRCNFMFKYCIFADVIS